MDLYPRRNSGRSPQAMAVSHTFSEGVVLREGLTVEREDHMGETAEVIEFDFDESSPVPRGWMLTPVVTNSQLSRANATA